MAKGVDYSWGRPSMSGLRAAGVTFACRYLSYDTSGKNLSRSEANALQGAGIGIVTNWEWGAADALGGASVGHRHATDAANMLSSVGAPSNAVIYFSVDFDVQPTDLHAVAAYADACVGVLGSNRVGIYGGYYLCQALNARGTCRYYWQTSAWSGGRWSVAAAIRQVQYGVYIGGGQVDIDESVVADIGMWGQQPGQASFGVVTAGPWDPTPAILDVAKYLYTGVNVLNNWANNFRIMRK